MKNRNVARPLFWYALRLEMKRSVCSIRFLLGAAMMLLLMCTNAAEAVGTYDHAVFAGVPVLIRFGINGDYATAPILLAISALPYSFSYLSEKECGFAKTYISRVGSTAYGVCKAISTAFSAFLMGAAALGAYILILTLMGIPHSVRYDEVVNTYAVLSAVKSPPWYYAIMLLKIGTVCSQAAMFALLVMSKIPNTYVGFLSPMIGYHAASCVNSILSRFLLNSFFWGLVSPFNIFFGESVTADPVFSYLWSMSMLIGMALFFGFSFVIQVEKERIG